MLNMQSIYGEKGKSPGPERSTKYPIIVNVTNPEETTTTTTKRPNPAKPEGDDKPDLCEDPKIDAITVLKDGRVYAFRGAIINKSL